MCRYAAYLGPPLALSELIYKPVNSLVHQASNASLSLTRINADGFGVGWYSPDIGPEPALFKDTSPMWNNRNLGDIADKIRAPCLFAHVRSAKSYDPVTRENCHPFRRGRLLWMHNGDIPGRVRLTRQVASLARDELLAQMRGNTDTELAFTLFLEHLDWAEDCDPSTDRLVAAMKKTLSRIVGWHLEADDLRPLELNFCVTTGTRLVASRFALSRTECPTLHWRSSSDKSTSLAVFIASEPLSDKDSWIAVENGSLLVVDANLTVETLSMPGTAAPASA